MQARQTANAVARGIYNDLAKQFERKAQEAIEPVPPALRKESRRAR